MSSSNEAAAVAPPGQSDPSAVSQEAIAEPKAGARPAIPALLWCGIAAITAIGCLGIYRDLAFLWAIWTTDPLRSIGMLILPASMLLTLRVWRQNRWEMRGTWWGLAVIGLSFGLSVLRHRVGLFAVLDGAGVTLIPLALPIYLYGCGIVLLFAGPRVWRRAWFPLGLLLLSQPVPGAVNTLLDIPLQNLSAHVARSFAMAIGFAPTTPQLRLMFSPDFGMFIAPGCDGIRGAVTMGYVALILGYLKRVSIYRWAAYVAGAVSLGYIFNFTRLCVLVLYYRVALGHPGPEGWAKWADYVIGGCLFLVATFLFLRLVRGKEETGGAASSASVSSGSAQPAAISWLKCAAVMALIVLALCFFGLRDNRKDGATPASFEGRMPERIGDFALTRAWYEQQDGVMLIQSGAYAAPSSEEITLGVWVGAGLHNANTCWLARGLQPDYLTTKTFVTANNKSVAFSEGFYSDGMTDSIVVSALCSPAFCSESPDAVPKNGFKVLSLRPEAANGHPVSIMVRIDRPYSNAPKAVTFDLLTAEAQRFLTNLDMTGLSGEFQ
ncbi:MAG: exosortase J [Terracidiphilus sp.]